MQKYSQHIAEAIIPILGFYFWNWSWYFILLFYILDATAKEIIIHLKSKKIYQTQGGDQSLIVWEKNGFKSAALAILTLVVLHFMYYINHKNVSFTQEIIAFLSYREMGISQGWVLVPLVGLNVWMQYKFTFLKFGLHTKLTLTSLWKEHVQFRNFYLLSTLIGLGLHSVFQFQDVAFVWVAIALPFLYLRFILQKT